MICRRRRIAFVHIPKTGGTTVESILFPHRNGDRGDLDRLAGWSDQRGWLNHLTWEQMVTLAPDVSHARLSFTVVRNPWDRLVSEFHWKGLGKCLGISFGQYVRRLIGGDIAEIQSCYRSPLAFEQHYRCQVDYLPSAAPAWFRVLQFESYEAQVLDFLRRCNVTLSNGLPRMRRSDHVCYTEYYDKFTVDGVRDLYRRDVEEFGYEFE